MSGSGPRVPDPDEQRDCLADRLRDAVVSVQRFIDVHDEAKATRDHEQHPPDADALDGNYGVYGGCGADGEGRWLVDVDVDDYVAGEDTPTDGLDSLPTTFTVESPHTDGDTGGHRFYAIDGNAGKALSDATGSSNPSPDWGEVRAHHQYVVGPGSQISPGGCVHDWCESCEGCDKDWCDGCADPDGGYYRIADDREIAVIDPETFAEAIAQDLDADTDDEVPDDPAESDLATVEEGSTSITRQSDREYDEFLDREDIEDALSHIDPDLDYPEWRRIGYALEDFFDSRQTAKSVFESWSRRGSKWDSQAKNLVEDISSGSNSSDRATIASVVHHTRKGGWDMPSPSASADGGTTTATVAAETETGTEQPDEDSFEGRMQSARVQLSISETSDGDRRHRSVGIDAAADALCDELDFVYPRERTRGWRERLHVYADGEHVGYGDEAGVYEPSGDRTVKRLTERHLADAADTGVLKQIVEKCKRRSDTRERRLRANPERMVVENGILDLETGNVDPHSPDEFHQTRIDVAYDPDAECPAIDEFIHDIVADEDVDTVYRLIAHTLYKDYPGEKATMLLGDGANGKTVPLTLIERFLGGSNTSGESLQELNDEQFSARNLIGNLANIDPDMGNQTVDNMATFKALTGRDTVSADVKFERPVQFENYATLLFAANDIPVLDDDTHGNWRRWIMLDFPNTFRPGDDDYVPKDELLDRLTTEEELEGLLARCVEEINEWAQSDREWFPSVDEPEEVRRRMRKASEPVFAFAEDCLEPDEDGRIGKADLRTLYNQYATENGLEKVSKEQFGERILGLTDYHIESERPNVAGGKRPRLYTGIELSEYGKRLDTDDEDDVNASITEGFRSSGTNSDLSMKEAVIQLLQDNDGALPLAELSGLALKEHGLAPDETHDVLNSLRRDGRVMNDDRHGNRWIVLVRQ